MPIVYLEIVAKLCHDAGFADNVRRCIVGRAIKAYDLQYCLADISKNEV